MAQRKGFFTPEMGSWLREMRAQARLTQDEVAARMGLQGKGRKSVVSTLEAGLVPNPYFSTIVHYLLACGATMGRFCDKFNTLGLLPVDPESFEDSGFPAQAKQRLLEKASRQVNKYQRRMRFPKKGKPVSPERQQKAAGKYRDYQVQVKVIQQAVAELLGRTSAAIVEVQAYLTYARTVLSALRKYQEPELSERLRRAEGYLELHGLDERIGRQIESLVVRVFAERAS
jgi:transcriptional regulator with XRE-family HTH domain